MIIIRTNHKKADPGGFLIWHENEQTMIIHAYSVSLFVSSKTCNHAEFLYIESSLLDKRRSAEQEVVGSNP